MEINSTLVFKNLTDGVGFEIICGDGSCPQLVLKQSLQDSRYPCEIAVDIIRLVLFPVILWYASCVLWNIYIISKCDPDCSHPLPPGSFGLPFVGETIYLLLDSQYYENRRRQHGRIYKTHLLGNPTIRVFGSESVKQILRGENSLVATQWPASTCQLLGEGSISHATGTAHVSRKRALMRAFTFKALSSYVPAIQSITREFINKWCRDGNILGYPEFRTLNFSLSCRVLAGLHLDYEESSKLMEVFETFTANIFCLPVNIPGSGFRKAMNARKVLLQKIDEVIRSREADGSKGETDLLGIMMKSEESEEANKAELKNLCLELLFAGHGTTSSAACFLVSELAKFPKFCERIKQEMTSYDFEYLGNESDIDLSTLNKMQYLNNVVKEALRLCPPIGGGFRKALKTFVIDGYQVPAGWSIIYGIRDTHETCTSFTDPHKFDPDRWNTSEVDMDKFSYLPFGGGRRACAGKDLAKLMLKIFVIELLRTCKWSLRNKKTHFNTFPVPYPTDDLPLTIDAI